MIAPRLQFLLVLLFSFCTLAGCRAQERKDARKGKLVLVRSLAFEEHGDSLIADVTHVCFSPNGSLALLTDESRGVLGLFDSNGKVRLFLEAGESFTDSMVARGRPYGEKDSFVFTHDLPRFASSRDQLSQLRQGLKNHFKGASFINDSEFIVTSLIRARMFRDRATSGPVIPNWLGGRNNLIRVNVHSGRWTYRMYDKGPGEWASADDDLCLYTPWNGHVITTNRNWQALEWEHFDSAFSLAEYDLDGRFQRIVSMLTPATLRSGLGYGFSSYTGMAGSDNSVWISDGINPILWNPEKQDTIDLGDVGDGNSGMLALAAEQAKSKRFASNLLLNRITLKIMFSGVGRDSQPRAGLCEFTGEFDTVLGSRPHLFRVREYDRNHRSFLEAILRDSGPASITDMAYNAARDEYWTLLFDKNKGWSANVYKLTEGK